MRTNDEIINIINELKEEKGISLSELARRVGMAKSALSRYFNKTREFPLNRVQDFANALGVTSEFILGFDKKDLPSNVIEVDKNDFVQVPILGEIACGDPILANENIIGYRYHLKDTLPKGNTFYLKAKGDSMEPRIPNGADVLIRQQNDVENGEIAAVLVNGDTEATLKRIYRQGTNISLVAENPAYPPYIVNKDNPAKILGKAIEVSFDL